MIIQNKNKFNTASLILSNIWLIVLLVVTIIFCSILFLQTTKLIWIIISIFSTIVFFVSVISSQKNKDRFNIERGYNLIRTSISKKGHVPKERLLITNECLKHKKDFIIGFKINFVDLNSCTQDNQELASQSFVSFVDNLPIGTSYQFKVVKTNAQVPIQFKKLNIEVCNYEKFNEYNYYLVCSTQDQKQVEKIINYVSNSYLDSIQLEIKQLINIITQ